MLKKEIQSAINNFVSEVAKASGDEPLDGDETKEIVKAVYEELDRTLANEPHKKYAMISWTVDDVLIEADNRGIEISKGEAEEILGEIEDEMISDMNAAGFNVIENALGTV